MITVRRAAPVDAAAIALVHVRAWQAAYRGLMPDDVLERLSVDERALRWRDILSNPWALSRGQGLRVTAVTMSIPALVIALALLESRLTPEHMFFPVAMLRSCAYSAFTVFEIAALSVTYRRLTAV